MGMLLHEGSPWRQHATPTENQLSSVERHFLLHEGVNDAHPLFLVFQSAIMRASEQVRSGMSSAARAA